MAVVDFPGAAFLVADHHHAAGQRRRPGGSGRQRRRRSTQDSGDLGDGGAGSGAGRAVGQGDQLRDPQQQVHRRRVLCPAAQARQRRCARGWALRPQARHRVVKGLGGLARIVALLVFQVVEDAVDCRASREADGGVGGRHHRGGSDAALHQRRRTQPAVAAQHAVGKAFQ
jgi:hypothetical protein